MGRHHASALLESNAFVSYTHLYVEVFPHCGLKLKDAWQSQLLKASLPLPAATITNMRVPHHNPSVQSAAEAVTAACCGNLHVLNTHLAPFFGCHCIPTGPHKVSPRAQPLAERGYTPMGVSGELCIHHYVTCTHGRAASIQFGCCESGVL